MVTTGQQMTLWPMNEYLDAEMLQEELISPVHLTAKQARVAQFQTIMRVNTDERNVEYTVAYRPEGYNRTHFAQFTMSIGAHRISSTGLLEVAKQFRPEWEDQMKQAVQAVLRRVALDRNH